MDALYFRVSSERQTTENQFDDLLQVAERDGAGRDWARMRELPSQCVYEEQLPGGRTVYRVRPVLPVKSQTGPISSTLGKLLWAMQAWYAEMENDERAEAVKAGQQRARAEGKHIGRPRVVFRRDEVPALRAQGLSWREVADKLGVGVGTVRRAFQAISDSPAPGADHAAAALAACQNLFSARIRMRSYNAAGSSYGALPWNSPQPV